MDSARVTEPLSIIIPAHNEEGRIGPTLREYAETFPHAAIIVVLNGCLDGTEAVVRRACERHANIRMITIRARVGKGGAVRAGFLLAQTPIVAFVDADSAFPAGEMLRLLAALGENDAVIASRWVRGARALSPLSFKRRAAGLGFNYLARALFGLPFRDTQCGAKVFRAASLLPIFDLLETSNFAFDVDLLYLLRRRHAKIVEVAVVWRDVVGSKVSVWRSGVQMAASIVRLRLRHSPLRYLLPLYDVVFPTQPLYFYDKLRILILNWRDLKNPAAGGAEVYLHEMAKRWVREGHEVEWLTARFPGSLKIEMVDGIKIHRIGNRLSLYLLAPFVYLQRFRNRFHVLVDSDNTIPFFSPSFSMKPKVCVMYQISRRVLALELIRPLVAVLAFLEERVMPAIYRHVPIVTISEDTAADIARERLTRQPVAIVKSGVSPSLRPGSKAQVPTLLYLGRLKRFKRVDLLIQSMHQIRERIPDARLVIAGSGDDEQRLRQLSASIGMQSSVTFFGHVDERLKMELLQSAWALVLPSVTEGWGIVVIEANACGTPAVGFDVRGLRGVIAHEETGLLVREGDSLAPALIRLLTDTQLRSCFEACALQHAATFSWDTAAEQMLAILTRLASDKPATLTRDAKQAKLQLSTPLEPVESLYLRR